jgi:CheY-like chemotaxis protein
MQGVATPLDERAQISARKPRILVVDDDRGVLDLLETFLDLAGFDVTTAMDGAEALGVAARGFDAITTDLAMPRMDGWEFIERLHDLPITPIPVVVVSAQNIDQSVSERVQFCRIMTKPCELEELARTLRSLLTTCSHSESRCSPCPHARQQ